MHVIYELRTCLRASSCNFVVDGQLLSFANNSLKNLNNSFFGEKKIQILAKTLRTYSRTLATTLANTHIHTHNAHSHTHTRTHARTYRGFSYCFIVLLRMDIIFLFTVRNLLSLIFIHIGWLLCQRLHAAFLVGVSIPGPWPGQYNFVQFCLLFCLCVT